MRHIIRNGPGPAVLHLHGVFDTVAVVLVISYFIVVVKTVVVPVEIERYLERAVYRRIGVIYPEAEGKPVGHRIRIGCAVSCRRLDDLEYGSLVCPLVRIIVLVVKIFFQVIDHSILIVFSVRDLYDILICSIIYIFRESLFQYRVIYPAGFAEYVHIEYAQLPGLNEFLQLVRAQIGYITAIAMLICIVPGVFTAIEIHYIIFSVYIILQ